jgi:hypothetical protein
VTEGSIERVKNKIVVDLMAYSHNRDVHYKKSADELFVLINSFADQKNLLELYSYFERAYNLPKNVVKQKIKHYLATAYIYKEQKFISKLNLSHIPKTALMYGGLFYALFFVKKYKNIKKYKLIIDQINSPHELSRFEKLLNLFGKENVLCIASNSIIEREFPEYNIYTNKFFRNFNVIDLIKSLCKELFFGFWVVLKASIKTRINLFPVSLKIIHNYLSFKSLFETNKAEYIIQERNYHTNSVKNYLFKKSGGIGSATIQKNIVEADLMFSCMDIDILFSLGNSGFQRLLDYGGRINKIEPVGSLFMEYYWFTKPLNIETQYDILFLGINVSTGSDRINKYEGWTNDYYSSFEWLVRIKNKNPKLKIAIKHHASAGMDDPIERKILKNSGIITLDKTLNSYHLAFSSRCAVTYGSTMGYELNAHNLPALFIDPGYRCAFLPEKEIDNLGALRITSYKKFDESINKILTSQDFINYPAERKSDLCIESSITSNKIFDYLQDNNLK